MKIVTIKGLWLLHRCTKFHIDIWSRLWVIELWNVENRTHTHTPHTYVSERQLQIIFLDVLDYSECSDTNISKKKIHENIASSTRKQNWDYNHAAISTITQKFLVCDMESWYKKKYPKFVMLRSFFKIFKNKKKIEKFKYSIKNE